MEKQITILTADEFQSFISEAKTASFFQSVEMAILLEKRGLSCQFVGLVVDGSIQVAALLFSQPLRGGLRMEINSGPVSTDSAYLSDFYVALKRYAKEKGALELVLKPYETYQTFDTTGHPLTEETTTYLDTLLSLGYQHDGLSTGYPEGEPSWHYVKDLSGYQEKDLLSSFDKKGMKAIRKASEYGVRLRKLSREELPIFEQLIRATARRKEFADKSLEYYQDFYDSFGSAASFMVASLNVPTYLSELLAQKEGVSEKLAQTTQQGVIRKLTEQLTSLERRLEEVTRWTADEETGNMLLAAALFIYSEHEATYLFGGSYQEFNRFYAPALLQEQAMKETIKRGIPLYNFLGITGDFDGSDGVLRFKQQFNGMIVRKMGTFRYFPHPFKAKLLYLLKRLVGR